MKGRIATLWRPTAINKGQLPLIRSYENGRVRLKGSQEPPPNWSMRVFRGNQSRRPLLAAAASIPGLVQCREGDDGGRGRCYHSIFSAVSKHTFRLMSPPLSLSLSSLPPSLSLSSLLPPSPLSSLLSPSLFFAEISPKRNLHAEATFFHRAEYSLSSVFRADLPSPLHRF